MTLETTNHIYYVEHEDEPDRIVKRLRFEYTEGFKEPSVFLLEWNSQESRCKDWVKYFNDDKANVWVEGFEVGKEFERIHADWKLRKGTRVRHKDSNGFSVRMFGYLLGVDADGVATVRDGDGARKRKRYYWNFDDIIFVKYGESWSGQDF